MQEVAILRRKCNKCKTIKYKDVIVNFCSCRQLFCFSLNISGCGIKPRPLSKTPAGVWSTTTAESPPTCADLLARAIGLVKTPLRSLDLSVNDIGSVSCVFAKYA